MIRWQFVNPMQILCMSNGSYMLLDSENTTYSYSKGWAITGLSWAGLGWVIKSTSIQLGTKILQSWEMIAWHRNPAWFYWIINFMDIYFHYWCILDVPHKISHYLRFHCDISSSQRFSFLKLLRYCPALFIADRDAVTSKSWFTRPIVSELCYDCL